LAVVISIDTLASGFAYGTSNTKVPLSHVIVVDLICSLTVSIALFFGYLVGRYISSTVTLSLGVGILVLLGGYKIIQYFINKSNGTSPTPRRIKWSETITLAMVLSLDGLAVGIGVSIHNTTLAFCFIVLCFSLVTDLVFFILGHKIGTKATKKTRFDLSWLSGAVLIILGVIKLL